uniref:Putative resolvase domain containing protein n=1 Tax=viral metagenome TaxID=1070528 RepID=A0A6M3IKQ8_9ZZZZ
MTRKEVGEKHPEAIAPKVVEPKPPKPPPVPRQQHYDPIPIIYCRKSPQDPGSRSLSVQAQDFHCRAWCMAHNILNPEAYWDSNSRSSAGNPHAFEEFNKLVSRSRVSHVIVTQLDRLPGDMTSIMAYLMKLVKRGIVVMSITENIDTSQPSGRSFMSAVALLAKIQSDRILESCKHSEYRTAAKYKYKPKNRPKRDYTTDLDLKPIEVMELGSVIAPGGARKIICQSVSPLVKAMTLYQLGLTHFEIGSLLPPSSTPFRPVPREPGPERTKALIKHAKRLLRKARKRGANLDHPNLYYPLREVTYKWVESVRYTTKSIANKIAGSDWDIRLARETERRKDLIDAERQVDESLMWHDERLDAQLLDIQDE